MNNNQAITVHGPPSLSPKTHLGFPPPPFSHRRNSVAWDHNRPRPLPAASSRSSPPPLPRCSLSPFHCLNFRSNHQPSSRSPRKLPRPRHPLQSLSTALRLADATTTSLELLHEPPTLFEASRPHHRHRSELNHPDLTVPLQHIDKLPTTIVTLRSTLPTLTTAVFAAVAVLLLERRCLSSPL